MAYTAQTWVDNNPAYPLSAARLSVMENGISAAFARADLSALHVYADSGGVYAGRPATPVATPVYFHGASAPAQNGSYTGGGGAVPNSNDRWIEEH
jgi:hypothetical protein